MSISSDFLFLNPRVTQDLRVAEGYSWVTIGIKRCKRGRKVGGQGKRAKKMEMNRKRGEEDRK